MPTFWEQNGGWVIAAGVLLAAGIAILVWKVTRPKPPTPVPWSVQARQELEPLSRQPEDGVLLSRVSQIMRHQIASAFELPLQETTTSEFCGVVAKCERIGPELSSELTEFLNECDRRKFAPSPPQSGYGAVSRSLKLIEGAEKRLAQTNNMDALTGKQDSSRLLKEEGEQRAASGA